MTEALFHLLPFKWRDVEVPLRRLRMSLAHDLVQHKPYGVDGARVEDTGLAPFRFTATIPFINAIAPSENERWKSGELYPGVFREFLAAFAKKTTGYMQHPEFGRVACKAENLDTEWTGESRGGIEVDASFVEARDDDVQHDVVRGAIEIEVEAVSFDTKDIDLRKIVPKLPEYKESFEDLARKISSVGDQTALLQQRLAGRIDSIVYRADQVQRSINNAKTALSWPATQNLERIKAAANDLRRKLLKEDRDLVLYIPPKPTTLAGVATQVPEAKLADLIALNPRLVAHPVIEANTVVRYYAPRKAA